MENNSNSVKTIVGAIVIVLLLAGLIFTSVMVSKGKKNLNAEKLAAEKTLSEKLAVEKELSKSKTDYSLLNERYLSLQKELADTQQQLTETENRIRSANSENRTLREKLTQLDELNRQKADLEKELANLKTEYNNMSTQNQNLQNRITALEKDKTDLTKKLDESSKILTDNFLVTATRGKKTERIVIWASRTKKLNITFEVPENIASAVSFSIVTPSGQVVNPNEKSLSWYFPIEYRNLTASMSPITGEFVASRQIVLNYVPKEKLQKGEYKIQILENGQIIGNCRMMLK
jgi:myosin heavy subunit